MYIKNLNKNFIQNNLRIMKKSKKCIGILNISKFNNYTKIMLFYKNKKISKIKQE